MSALPALTPTHVGERALPAARPERRAFVEHIMGMPVSIHLRGYALGRAEVLEAVADAYDALRHFDAVFSTYRADSDLSRLTRGETSLHDCDPLVADALDLAAAAAAATGGLFTSTLPDGSGQLRFDPTGLVKGWAVDVAAEALEALAGVSFCINAGGDVLVGGTDAFGPWRVGIEDPNDRSRVARTVPLTQGAVATSGCVARGAHLYDPTVGGLVDRPGSSTAFGPGSLMWADIWATALFIGGTAAEHRMLDAAPHLQAITL